MAGLLRLLLVLWRSTIGQLVPRSCRFTPSCSRYAEEALQRKGALRGSYLAARRLLRCHPRSQGGYDPVVASSPPCR